MQKLPLGLTTLELQSLALFLVFVPNSCHVSVKAANSTWKIVFTEQEHWVAKQSPKFISRVIHRTMKISKLKSGNIAPRKFRNFKAKESVRYGVPEFLHGKNQVIGTACEYVWI